MKRQSYLCSHAFCSACWWARFRWLNRLSLKNIMGFIFLVLCITCKILLLKTLKMQTKEENLYFFYEISLGSRDNWSERYSHKRSFLSLSPHCNLNTPWKFAPEDQGTQQNCVGYVQGYCTQFWLIPPITLQLPHATFHTILEGPPTLKSNSWEWSRQWHRDKGGQVP